jgi:predicted GIY-YIG superfamily endonuclease
MVRYYDMENRINHRQTSGYVLSRKKYFPSPNLDVAPSGRTYIYVLFLSNGPGCPSIPFYVGQTTDLRKRFSSHQQIIWHKAKWNRASIVHVVATVPLSLSTKAEYSLIQMLRRSSFLLNNDHPKSNDVFINALSESSFEQYLKKAHDNPFLVIKEWQSKWRKAEDIEKALNYSALKRENKVLPHDLIRVIQKRKYASDGAHRLSRKIAEAYDPLLGESAIIISPNTEQQQIAAFKKMKGDWTPLNELKSNELIRFQPSQSLLTAVEAEKRRQEK